MLLNLPITPARLIDMAKDHSGMELQAMAAELGYAKTRITKLKAGACALTPTEVKYYADKAGLPFEQTICELEMLRNPIAAKVWGMPESEAITISKKISGVIHQTIDRAAQNDEWSHGGTTQKRPTCRRARAAGRHRNAT